MEEGNIKIIKEKQQFQLAREKIILADTNIVLDIRFACIDLDA